MTNNNCSLPKITRRECVTALVATAGCATLGFARERTGRHRPASFESLFDGKTLDGWHRNRQRIGHGKGGLWEVVDGHLEGQQDPPGSGNGGLLLTDRKLSDFELEIDLLPDWGPDSGVFFRYELLGRSGSIGLQVHGGKSWPKGAKCRWKNIRVRELN